MKTPRRIVMTKAGPYRMRYRPDPIERLAESFRDGRIPMIGDPPGLHFGPAFRHAHSLAIYQAMIIAKDRARRHEVIRSCQRRGLWLWAV